MGTHQTDGGLNGGTQLIAVSAVDAYSHSAAVPIDTLKENEMMDACAWGDASVPLCDDDASPFHSEPRTSCTEQSSCPLAAATWTSTCGSSLVAPSSWTNPALPLFTTEAGRT